MLHRNMGFGVAIQPCILTRSQLFKRGRVVDFERRGRRRELLERADELPRGGHGEMSEKRGPVGPLFDENEPQRIVAIDVNGVRHAAGFGA